MNFELFISSRFMKSRKKSAFISLITILSVVGVAMGVMTLMVVLAVMTGYKTEITSRILDENAHIHILHQSGYFMGYKDIIERVEQIPGVENAVPSIFAQVMLQSSSNVSSAVLHGINPQDDSRLAPYFKRTEESDSARMERSAMPEIVLGKQLAGKLNVNKGDVVYLMSSQGISGVTSSVPRMSRFYVAGCFESGMYEYDNTFAYVRLSRVQKLLNTDDAVSGIRIRVHDIYHADEIAAQIGRIYMYPFWVRDWMEMNKNLLSMLKLQKTVLFIILTLIILVAAFNISGTLFMMVMERTRDIAILRSMGATRRVIEKIFIIRGMIISFAGTCLGLTLGFVMCGLLKKYQFIKIPEDVYFLTTLPVEVDAFSVSLITISSLLICFFATLYPARKASRLNPVEAMRNG